MENENSVLTKCGMSGEPLDCGIQWSRETPQEPAPGDEEHSCFITLKVLEKKIALIYDA